MKPNFFFSSLVLFVCTSCTLIPVDGFDNTEAIERDKAEAPLTGSTIATLAVPWHYRFSDPSVTPEQAARCRDALFSIKDEPSKGERLSAPECNSIEEDETLFAVAISGGGVRAAVLGNAVLYHLDQIGLMKHIDMISGISGGAFGAGLHGVSCGFSDPEIMKVVSNQNSDCVWKKQLEKEAAVLPWIRDFKSSDSFYERFTHDVLSDWVMDLLIAPWHGWRTLVTEYNRTRVIADSFADGPYELPEQNLPFGILSDGFEYRHLNPKRPNLIIQATDMTQPKNVHDIPGKCFRFTRETFDKINSDLNKFPLADAIAASNAFAVVFPPYILRDFSDDEEERYIHLQDGGIRDHISLSPVLEVVFHAVEGVAPQWSDEIPSDFCDISRYPQIQDETKEVEGEARHEDKEKYYNVGFIEGKDGAKHWISKNPKNIIIFVIDASKPPEGIVATSATPTYESAGLMTRIFDSFTSFRKGLQAVDTILDDQRTLRARETLDFLKIVNGVNDSKTKKNLEETNVISVVLSNHDYFVKHRPDNPKGDCGVNDQISVKDIDPEQVSVHSLQKFTESEESEELGCKDDKIRNQLYKDLKSMSLGMDLRRKISTRDEKDKESWVNALPKDWIDSNVLGGKQRKGELGFGRFDEIQTIIQASGVLVARMAETRCQGTGKLLFANLPSIECTNLKHLCQYVPIGRRQNTPWKKACRGEGLAETSGAALLN